MAASAQTAEEAAAIAAFEEALDGFECLTFEGCIEDIAELKAALAGLKAVFPGLDYATLDAAIAALEAAIVDGDLDDVAAAFDAVKAAGASVLAAAVAAAGGTTTTTAAATTTTVAAPTAVATGSPVDSGPNVALLGVAALLVLLTGGALAIRLTADRR
jgi:hypothetical protein